jgi:glycine/D-amino acid oxidase-like deaminating enzyme
MDLPRLCHGNEGGEGRASQIIPGPWQEQWWSLESRRTPWRLVSRQLWWWLSLRLQNIFQGSKSRRRSWCADVQDRHE